MQNMLDCSSEIEVASSQEDETEAKLQSQIVTSNNVCFQTSSSGAHSVNCTLSFRLVDL